MDKILLVEDDNSLGYLLSEYLKMKSFQLVWAKDGLMALEILKKEDFDLIILDVMMPKMDGFTLASKVRDSFPSIPFIFLTARSLKIDVLKGFSLGAVDYLKKPIDEEELVVRIQTLLSRLKINSPENSDSDEISIGNYKFHYKNQQLKYREEDVVSLTARESELLMFLYRHKNELSLHKDILVTIWGENDYFNRKSLNVFISHLRKYLSKDASISIENVHNKGFLFKIDQ
ncbi:response regulator transcription factor [Joostella atrarenae]|uniref:Response regulator transcription factor n=1 Tax=Joostella atrarenae TaxID=679257 RepID=A0ABS9J0G6_9FLAO|nr:response regulator transcription factor [Joostella atrarenae]MCF8713926.1 response regulator transcription factor [Joostella atrarenae]